MHVCNNVSPLTSLLGANVAPCWRRDVHYLDGCSRAAICVLAFGLKCVSVSSTCKACSSKRGPGWWAACVAHHGQLLLLRHATHAVYSEGLGGGLILSWWWAACVAQNGRWLLLRHAWYAVYSDGLGGGLIMGWWAATVRVWRTMAMCCCRDSPEPQGSCIFLWSSQYAAFSLYVSTSTIAFPSGSQQQPPFHDGSGFSSSSHLFLMIRDRVWEQQVATDHAAAAGWTATIMRVG